MRGQTRDGRFGVSPRSPLAAATFDTKRTTMRYAVAIVIGACIIAFLVTGASPVHAEAITQQRLKAIQDECVQGAFAGKPNFKTIGATVERCVAAKQEALLSGLPDLIALMRPYWDARIAIAEKFDAGKMSLAERDREFAAALDENEKAFDRWEKAWDHAHDNAPSQPPRREFTCAVGPGSVLTCR